LVFSGKCSYNILNFIAFDRSLPAAEPSSSPASLVFFPFSPALAFPFAFALALGFFPSPSFFSALSPASSPSSTGGSLTLLPSSLTLSPSPEPAVSCLLSSAATPVFAFFGSTSLPS
jgi:hypothetical protein